jgi:hypothetical protein
MTTAPMTVEPVLCWKAYEKMVNRREIEELSDATTKLRQMEAMMASHALLESPAEREAGVEYVRQRWLKLRRAYENECKHEVAQKTGKVRLQPMPKAVNKKSAQKKVTGNSKKVAAKKKAASSSRKKSNRD